MENHINFCNYLRLKTEAVEEYSSLNKELSIKYANDRSSYTNGKNDFIKSILKRQKRNFHLMNILPQVSYYIAIFLY